MGIGLGFDGFWHKSRTRRAVTALLAYILRTDFSAVTGQPVTLTDGQVLDTAGEGMVDGTLVAKGTTMQINGNGVYCNSTGVAAWSTDGAVSQLPISRAAGQVLIARVKTPPAINSEWEMLLGLVPSDVLATGIADTYTAYFRGTGYVEAYYGSGNGGQISSILSADTVYELAYVLDGIGCHMYIKGAAQYPQWTLIFVFPSGVADPYLHYHIGVAGGQWTLLGVMAPVDLHPDLLLPAIRDSFGADPNGTLLTSHVADTGETWTNPTGEFQIIDGAAEVTVDDGTYGVYGIIQTTTEPRIIQCDISSTTAGGISCRFTGAGAPQFLVRWNQGGAKVEMYELVTNWVLRASAALSGTPGEAHTLTVILGSNRITAFVNDYAGLVSYSSAALNTNTGVGFRGGLGDRFSNFRIFYQTDSEYNRILSGVTGAGLIVFDGNSLTVGQGATAGNDYPSQVTALISTPHTYYNFGVGAQTTTDMVADAASQIDSLYNADLPINIVVAWEITNEIYYGTTAQAAYDNFVAYCQARKAAGFKVVALTVLPRSNAGTPADFEDKRQSANSLIRANWGTFADALADVAADSRIGDAGDELDTTYYNADQVHMTDAGYGIIAATVKASLDGI